MLFLEPPTKPKRGIRLLKARRTYHFGRDAPPVHPATLFTPQDPGLTPDEHFPLQTVRGPDRTIHPRFVNRFDSREMLLAVDGSCLANGREDRESAGGCSFVWRAPVDDSEGGAAVGPSPTTFPFDRKKYPRLDDYIDDNITGKIAFPLEAQGPTGLNRPHTSNRAKLRAVIAALAFRPWAEEGWRRVIVLTDLQYVAFGATTWLPTWIERGWRVGGGSRPKSKSRRNRDLWEELQGLVEDLRMSGCEVSFWLVPVGGQRGVIMEEAKEAAKVAASEKEAPATFTRLAGIMV